MLNYICLFYFSIDSYGGAGYVTSSFVLEQDTLTLLLGVLHENTLWWSDSVETRFRWFSWECRPLHVLYGLHFVKYALICYNWSLFAHKRLLEELGVFGWFLVGHEWSSSAHAELAHAARIIELFHLWCQKRRLRIRDLLMVVVLARLSHHSTAIGDGSVTWRQNAFIWIWTYFWRLLVDGHLYTLL